MANIKISQLTAAGAALGTQEFEVNESGTSKKVTGSQIKNFVKDGLVVSDITDLTASASELNQLDTNTFTTDITIPDKIVHAGDTNTAIRFPAADTVTVETAGTERMRIDASGNLGIGTTSPATISTGITTLDLKGNSGAQTDRSGGVQFTRYDGTVGMQIYHGDSANSIVGLSTYPTLFFTNGAERFRIASAGQLGIGGANYGTSGQVLTSGGSGAAPSWASVGTATAGLAVGDVGSYAFLNDPSNTSARTAGATVAGSSLRYSAIGADGQNAVNGNVCVSSSGTPSGTWRLMGSNVFISGYEHSSLWLRIS